MSKVSDLENYGLIELQLPIYYQSQHDPPSKIIKK